MSRGRKGRCGRPLALIDPWEVPTVHRTSYRKWAAKVEVSLSSLWLLCESVGVRRHTRCVMPTLTDKQRVDRVGFVLSYLHRRGRSGVHVRRGPCGREVVLPDKGWKKVYLQQDEEVPKPPLASNKRFILKMMLLAPVARPRKLSNGVWFDGTACQQKPCQGRPCPQASHGGREKYKKIIIDEDIPAVKAKMPRPPGHTIFGRRGHGGNSGRGWEQHHTRDPAFQLPRPQRGRSWLLPLHQAAEGGRESDHC
ncbi:unnamed protein product [Discosporangium mesarthrocarpum]